MASEFGSTVVVARPENRALEGATLLSIKRQPWYINILVRAARTFLQVFLALIGGAAIIPTAIPAAMRGFVLMPFVEQAEVAAQLAALAALVAVLQNLLELLTKLDVGSPELRG